MSDIYCADSVLVLNEILHALTRIEKLLESQFEASADGKLKVLKVRLDRLEQDMRGLGYRIEKP